jgi:hypothetical protein
MPTFEEYRRRPRAAMLARLTRTASDLASVLAAHDDAALSRRPEPKSWSATEIVCHLRDVEELFQVRFHTILALDEPTIFVLGAGPVELAPWRVGGGVRHPLDPDCWAEERQYARNDARAALAAFQRRRGEVLYVLSALAEPEWMRVGIHLARGRLTLAEWAASLAAHDDNHLAQLERALDGRG